MFKLVHLMSTVFAIYSVFTSLTCRIFAAAIAVGTLIIRSIIKRKQS